MSVNMGYLSCREPREIVDTEETIKGEEGRYKSPTEEACAGLQGVVGRLAEIVEEFEHRLRPVMSVEGDSPTAEARMDSGKTLSMSMSLPLIRTIFSSTKFSVMMTAKGLP